MNSLGRRSENREIKNDVNKRHCGRDTRINRRDDGGDRAGGVGPDGSLRREAAKAGIPSIIYEAGEPYRFQEVEIKRGVQGVENILAYLDMIDREDQEIADSRIYERSRWVRTATDQGGFFFPTAELGEIVEAGDSLGKVVDPLTDKEFDVVSPIPGEIIGMAVSQPVLSGYALFHLAWHDPG